MKRTAKQFIAAVTAAGILVSCGCASAADYSENTGEINLDAMSVTGSGISVSDKVITISAGGDFTVSGTASDAMIHVSATDKVKLRLSGMSLKNTDGPAIFFENAEKALVTLSEGTENYLEDGAQYDTDAKAALFSNEDLEIKGGGALTVTGNYKHGIASDDDVKIENGTINITANVSDGVHANKDIEITGGNITVSARKQGFQSEENFIMSGGKVTVTESSEGIESGGSITINGGETDITASDDGFNSGGGNGTELRFGGMGGRGEFDPNSAPPMPEGDLGGRGNFDPNGTPPPMPEGDFGGRGGMRRDGNSPDSQLPPGNPMRAADDGVDRNIYINGGIIRVDAGGDGLDSNADIVMTDGTVYIDGPTNSGNGAIDCFNFDVSGGEVIAVGASGMAMGVSEGSAQCAMLITTDTIAAGTELELKDGAETVMTFTPKKDISSIAYSSDKLKEGAEYTLCADGEKIETISMTAAQVTVGSQRDGQNQRGERQNRGGAFKVTDEGGGVRLDVNADVGETFLDMLKSLLGKLGLNVEGKEGNGYKITSQK